MNSEQLGSLLRQVLLFVGGIMVSRGYVDSETMVGIVGIAVTVATGGYGLYIRRKAGLIASAAAQPEVAKIVATPAVAKAVPNDKVVTQ